MDGMYATMTGALPYLDDASPQVRFWANKYKTKFNEDPSVFSAAGYGIVDAFAAAATKAGPNLTTESFIKAMDTMKIAPDIFGAPEQTFSSTKRFGSEVTRLSQIADGRWKVVSDYAK